MPVPVPGEPTPSVRRRVASVLARALRSLPLSFGKRCPRCGGPMYRIRTVWYAIPVRSLLSRYSSTRVCHSCHWKGFTLHRGT